MSTATTLELVIPPKRYRIGEIVQHTGLSRQTIHNYTIMGLLVEAERTAGGHRLYDETVFYRLRKIGELKQNCSMEQVCQELARMDAGGLGV
jgi:DNA-binding transcriptional MerR regulator